MGIKSFHSLGGSLGGLDSTYGTLTTARLISAAGTTNATNVKATPGRVFHIFGYNAATSVTYLKLYNKATAPDQNDTPTHTLALPPSAGFCFDWPEGRYFDTGIGYRTIGAAGNADNATTAVTAGDILGLNVEYS